MPLNVINVNQKIFIKMGLFVVAVYLNVLSVLMIAVALNAKAYIEVWLLLIVHVMKDTGMILQKKTARIVNHNVANAKMGRNVQNVKD